MTLFDLSHPIGTGMPVYPGDPQVSIESELRIDDDGVNVAHLRLGSHTGTHLDAPSHSVPDGRTVDQLDLELLDGIACIVPARNMRPGDLAAQEISFEDLGPIPEQLPRIVCIATGWDQHFHSALREHHPFLDPALARELWNRGARVLGVDTLSPDPTSAQSHAFPVHDFWLGHDGVIVENLRGLTELPDQVQMSLLPLNLTGLDGSPVRAVARIL